MKVLKKNENIIIDRKRNIGGLEFMTPSVNIAASMITAYGAVKTTSFDRINRIDKDTILVIYPDNFL